MRKTQILEHACGIAFFLPKIAELNDGSVSNGLMCPEIRSPNESSLFNAISCLPHPILAPVAYAQFQRPSGPKQVSQTLKPCGPPNSQQPATGPSRSHRHPGGCFFASSPASASSIRIHWVSNRLDPGYQMESDRDRGGSPTRLRPSLETGKIFQICAKGEFLGHACAIATFPQKSLTEASQ
ncbi:hypothetical protein C8J57DRAFT_1480649 [Mycena rebaudengoi]|nr:hypothetical protein C8J57DRAFT_1480649 [Mycena rebaudengoi]